MPLLAAVSSSARQLYLLLRCISFAPKAQVQISSEGLRVSVEESRVLQAFVFLDKMLFTTFRYDEQTAPGSMPGQQGNNSDEVPESPIFQISLIALLETLQIFGFADSKDRWSSQDTAYTSGINSTYARNGISSAFDNRILGMSGICRISYESIGSRLCITLEEGNVTTTCSLQTFEPEAAPDVPFDRDALALKVIMRASLLHDAITELTAISPDHLTLTASPDAPFFALSAIGPLGSATVEFAKNASLLETFQVPHQTVNTYKFSLVKSAVKAMSAATKVSIRGDHQGVLSLQFLIEVGNGTGGNEVSFVDFRFVPFVSEDEDGETDEGQEDEAQDDVTDDD